MSLLPNKLLINCFLGLFYSTFSALALQSTSTTFNQDIGFIFKDKNLKSITLPIKVFHNLVLVSVQINGSFPMDFILDTGVQTTILTEPILCDIFNIKTTRDVRLRGLGVGDTIIARLSSDITISLGQGQVQGLGMNLLVLPPDILSFSDFLGMPVYGIIGYDLFRDFVVEINYGQNMLRLYKPEKYKQPSKKWLSATLEVINTKPYIMAKVQPCEGDVLAQKLLIDIGSSQAISLNSNETSLPEKTLEAFLGKGLSGLVLGKIGRICSFQIADFSFQNVIAGFPNAESLGGGLQTNILWSGSIGGEIFKRFTVVLDYSHQKIYLKPNRHYKAPFGYNMSGLELLVEPPNYESVKINYVRPNSIAAQADLRVNDKIIELNGLLPQTTPIGDLYHELNKRAGYKINLKIERNGVILKKKFQLTNSL